MFNNEQQYFPQNYQPRQDHLSRVPEWSYNNPLLPYSAAPVAQPPFFSQHQYQNYSNPQITPNSMPALLNNNHPSTNPSTSIPRTNFCPYPPWNVNSTPTSYSRNLKKYSCHPSCRSNCRYQKATTLPNEHEASNRAAATAWYPPSFWHPSGLPPPPSPRTTMPISNGSWQQIPSTTSTRPSSSLSIAPAPTPFSNEIKHSQARISRTLNHASPSSNDMFSGYASSFRPYIDTSRQIHKPINESIPPIHSNIEIQNTQLINNLINHSPVPNTNTTTSSISITNSKTNDNITLSQEINPPRLDLRQYLSTWDESDESVLIPASTSTEIESISVNNQNNNNINNNNNMDNNNNSNTMNTNISVLQTPQTSENTQQLLLVGTTENDLIECLLQKPESITAVDSKTGAILDLSMTNKVPRFETSQNPSTAVPAASILLEENSTKELDFDFDCSFLQQPVNSSKKQLNETEVTRDMPRLESPVQEPNSSGINYKIINKSTSHIYEKTGTENIKKFEFRSQSAPPNPLIEYTTMPVNIQTTFSNLTQINLLSDKIEKSSFSHSSNGKLLDNTNDAEESQSPSKSRTSNENSFENKDAKLANNLNLKESKKQQNNTITTPSELLWHPRMQSVIKRNTFSQPCENSKMSVHLNTNEKISKLPEKIINYHLPLEKEKLSHTSMKEMKINEEYNAAKKDIVPFSNDKEDLKKLNHRENYLHNGIEKTIFFRDNPSENVKNKHVDDSSKKENYFSDANFSKHELPTNNELNSLENQISFQNNINSEIHQNNNENNIEMTSSFNQEVTLEKDKKNKSLEDDIEENLMSPEINLINKPRGEDISENNNDASNDSLPNNNNQFTSEQSNYATLNNSESISLLIDKENEIDSLLNKEQNNKLRPDNNKNIEYETSMDPLSNNEKEKAEITINSEKNQDNIKNTNLISESNISKNGNKLKLIQLFDENINLVKVDTPQSISSSPECGVQILKEENISNQDSSKDSSEKSNALEKITDKQVITTSNQNINVNGDQNLENDISFSENETTINKSPINSNDSNNKSPSNSNDSNSKSPSDSNDSNNTSPSNSNDSNSKSPSNSNDSNNKSPSNSNDPNSKSPSDSNDSNNKSSSSSNDSNSKSPSDSNSNDSNNKSTSNSNDSNSKSPSNSNSNDSNNKSTSNSNDSNNKSPSNSNSNDSNNKSTSNSNDSNNKSTSNSNDSNNKSTSNSNDSNNKSTSNSNDSNNKIKETESNDSNKNITANNNHKPSDLDNNKNEETQNIENKTKKSEVPLISPSLLQGPNAIQTFLNNLDDVSHEEMIENDEPNDYSHVSSPSTPEPPEFSLYMYQGHIPLRIFPKEENEPETESLTSNHKLTNFKMVKVDSFEPFYNESLISNIGDNSESSDNSNLSINGENSQEMDPIKRMQLKDKEKDIRRYKPLSFNLGPDCESKKKIFEVTSEKLREKSFNSNIVLYECISKTSFISITDIADEKKQNTKNELKVRFIQPREVFYHLAHDKKKLMSNNGTNINQITNVENQIISHTNTKDTTNEDPISINDSTNEVTNSKINNENNDNIQMNEQTCSTSGDTKARSQVNIVNKNSSNKNQNNEEEKDPIPPPKKAKLKKSKDISSKILSEKTVMKTDQEYVHKYKQTSKIIQRYNIANEKKRNKSLDLNKNKKNVLKTYSYKQHKLKNYISRYNSSSSTDKKQFSSSISIMKERKSTDTTKPPQLESIEMLREEKVTRQNDPPRLEPMAETPKPILPSLPRVVIRRNFSGYTSHLKPPDDQLQPVVLLQRSPQLDILANSILNENYQSSCSIFLRFRESNDNTEKLKKKSSNNKINHINKDINHKKTKDENKGIIVEKKACLSSENPIPSDQLTSSNKNLNERNTSPLNENSNPSTSKEYSSDKNNSLKKSGKVTPIKFKTLKTKLIKFERNKHSEDRWVMAKDNRIHGNETDSKYPLSMKIIRKTCLKKSKKNTISKKNRHKIDTKAHYISHKEKFFKKYSKNAKTKMLVESYENCQTYTSLSNRCKASPNESERSHLNGNEGQKALSDPKNNVSMDTTELSPLPNVSLDTTELCPLPSNSRQSFISSPKSDNLVNLNDLSEPTETDTSFLDNIEDNSFSSKIKKMTCELCSNDIQNQNDSFRREKYHCCLCQRSFDSESKYAKHTAGRWHQLIERNQQRAIDAVCSILTGHPSPGVNSTAMSTPSSTSSNSWGEPGKHEVLHKATTQSEALQNLMKYQKDQDDPSIPASKQTDEEDSSQNVP